jgi:hypothetical protein
MNNDNNLGIVSANFIIQEFSEYSSNIFQVTGWICRWQIERRGRWLSVVHCFCLSSSSVFSDALVVWWLIQARVELCWVLGQHASSLGTRAMMMVLVTRGYPRVPVAVAEENHVYSRSPDRWPRRQSACIPARRSFNRTDKPRFRICNSSSIWTSSSSS